jgi:hypothetical protein
MWRRGRRSHRRGCWGCWLMTPSSPAAGRRARAALLFRTVICLTAAALAQAGALRPGRPRSALALQGAGPARAGGGGAAILHCYVLSTHGDSRYKTERGEGHDRTGRLGTSAAASPRTAGSTPAASRARETSASTRAARPSCAAGTA